MNLPELQTAMMRALFSPSIAAEDRAVLADPRIEVYRELARSRLDGLLCTAFPRSMPLLPGAVEAYLALGAPRSRFLRDVPLLFGDAVLRGELIEPPHLADLVRLEAARWRAMIAEEREEAVVPFDLERLPVPSATLTLLAPSWSVHRDEIAPSTDTVLVYRRRDDVVETRWATGLSGRLLRGWAIGDRPAIEVAREALAAEGRAADAAFVEVMSELGATLLERGAILGSS